MRLHELEEVSVGAVVPARPVVGLRSDVCVVGGRLPRFSGEFVDGGVEGREDGGVGG